MQKGKAPFILSGGLGKKERTAMLKAIQETPRDKDLIVVATGQYVGEGFDYSTPFSWHSRLLTRAN